MNATNWPLGPFVVTAIHPTRGEAYIVDCNHDTLEADAKGSVKWKLDPIDAIYTTYAAASVIVKHLNAVGVKAIAKDCVSI